MFIRWGYLLLFISLKKKSFGWIDISRTTIESINKLNVETTFQPGHLTKESDLMKVEIPFHFYKVMYLWTVIRVDWGEAQADSVRPRTVFSLWMFFLKSLTLSSCGMICGMVCRSSWEALRPFSRSAMNADTLTSLISQCPAGVYDLLQSLLYNSIKSVCRDWNRGLLCIVLKSKKARFKHCWNVAWCG